MAVGGGPANATLYLQCPPVIQAQDAASLGDATLRACYYLVVTGLPQLPGRYGTNKEKEEESKYLGLAG